MSCKRDQQTSGETGPGRSLQRRAAEKRRAGHSDGAEEGEHGAGEGNSRAGQGQGVGPRPMGGRRSQGPSAIYHPSQKETENHRGPLGGAVCVCKSSHLSTSHLNRAHSRSDGRVRLATALLRLHCVSPTPWRRANHTSSLLKCRPFKCSEAFLQVFF